MPTEAPNNLQSDARLTFVDLMSEGTIGGFWPVSGVSGTNPLCSVYFDGVPLMNGDGSINYNLSGQGFAFDWRSGTSGQFAMTGFGTPEAFLPLPANTRIYNPPAGNGSPYSPTTSFTTNQYPDAESIKVTVRVPALYTIDDAGSTNQFNESYAVEVTVNGNNWQTLATENIFGKCISDYLLTTQYKLPKTVPVLPFYAWKVRVRRVGNNVISSQTANDLFLYSIAIVSSNTYRYPMSATVGLQLSADQFGSIPSRAYDIKGVKVLVPQGYTPTQYDQVSFSRPCGTTSGSADITTSLITNIQPGTQVSGPGIQPGSYVVSISDPFPFTYVLTLNQTATDSATLVGINFITFTGQITPATYPTIWNGVFADERQWTDNPAWILYDFITNKRYGLGDYVRAEWMDKWAIYQIAQFCDQMVDDGEGGLEPQFTCNIAITQAQDAYTLMNNLVSVFRGMMYWANGRLIPVGSETRNPVFNFTNANAVGGAFNYSDTPRNTRSSVVVIKWNDPENQFRSTPERVEDPAAISRYGYIEKQITSFACTSRGQAIRAANWILTVEQQLTETVQFQTDLEGLYLRPGDVFGVYDNYRTNQQQGGRIVSFDSNRSGIVLDRQVNLQPGMVYFMSALVPKATYTATGDITGSDQIDLIRNSQFDVRRVYTPAASGISQISLTSGFGTGLMPGAIFVLSASGVSASIFDQAIQYRCLATSEPSNGVTEVLGVRYQTGINTFVNRNYNAITMPPQIGDLVAPVAPTGLQATSVSGIMVDNTFFYYAKLNWTPSPSTNVAFYRVSGILPGGVYTGLIGQPQNNVLNINLPTLGTYTFMVGAVNGNGIGSAFNTLSYTLGSSNPLGVTKPLSGIYIQPAFPGADSGPDYTYLNATSGVTGYVGTTPSFAWNIVQTSGGFNEPTSQFISGYRLRFLQLGNESVSLMKPGGDIYISGFENDEYTIPVNYLATGLTVSQVRGFTLSVDTIDNFANTQSGARLAVNNPPPLPPSSSGFVGFNGGFAYSAYPNPQSESLSGIYLWWNNSPSFTPTFSNVQAVTDNFAGSQTTQKTNAYYAWFALVDTYGTGGSIAAANDYQPPIYGPLLMDPNAVISGIINWGFGLTPDGKVSGMVSIAPTGNGQNPYGRIGDIIFAGANLLSDNYFPGASGWKMSYNGDVEFNSGHFRGNLTAAGDSVFIGLQNGQWSSFPTIVIEDTPTNGIVAVNSASWITQKHTTDSIGSNSPWSYADTYYHDVWIGAFNSFQTGLCSRINSSSILFGSGNNVFDAGVYRTKAGQTNIVGNLTVASGSISGYTANYLTPGLDAGGGVGGVLHVGGGIGTLGGIRYSGGGAGSNLIAFYWDGANVKVLVDGNAAGTIPNP